MRGKKDVIRYHKVSRHECHVSRRAFWCFPEAHTLHDAGDPIADKLLEAPIHHTSSQPGVMRPLVSPPKKRAVSEYQWAVKGGIPDVATAFNRLRPSLAMTHPFELDTFQKEAVIHLEQVWSPAFKCMPYTWEILLANA